MDAQRIVSHHRNNTAANLDDGEWTLAAAIEHLIWLRNNDGVVVPATALWSQLRAAKWPAPVARSITHEGTHIVILPLQEDPSFLRDLDRDLREQLGQAGFTPKMAKALSGALAEIIGNIWEHAQTTIPGLLAYQCADERLTASIADVGIGVLQSLRSNPTYANLRSSLHALRTAMVVGVSRITNQNRGHGFDELLRAVADNHGTVRLRSGQGILSFHGSTDIRTAAGAYGVDLPGLHVALTCGLKPSNQPIEL
jgi:anti-sigma regulatory factor (Ser/Thr protein kinase)